MLGGNVFGWTADEATSHAILDAFVAGGFNAIDTADVYSAWVPGNTGGDSEEVLGTWLKGRGLRGVAQAAPDRLHRSLPVAPRRRRNAPGRDAGGLWPAGEGRQGAGHRRLELRGRAARLGPGDQRGEGPSPPRHPAAGLQPDGPERGGVAAAALSG